MTSRLFFGNPGDDTFYCAIPNHRTYGMQGTVHVTGPAITLDQAEAAGKSSDASSVPATTTSK